MTLKPDRCPRCGSVKVARVLYGLPRFDEELERRLSAGRSPWAAAVSRATNRTGNAFDAIIGSVGRMLPCRCTGGLRSWCEFSTMKYWKMTTAWHDRATRRSPTPARSAAQRKWRASSTDFSRLRRSVSDNSTPGRSSWAAAPPVRTSSPSGSASNAIMDSVNRLTNWYGSGWLRSWTGCSGNCDSEQQRRGRAI